MTGKVLLWLLGFFGGLFILSWLDVKHQEKIVEKAFLEYDILHDPASRAGDGYSVLRQRTA